MMHAHCTVLLDDEHCAPDFSVISLIDLYCTLHIAALAATIYVICFPMYTSFIQYITVILFVLDTFSISLSYCFCWILFRYITTGYFHNITVILFLLDTLTISRSYCFYWILSLYHDHIANR